jgi:predicted nucleotide-binding protein (sugar kinase/HSP70/actin superfamily)
MSTVKALYGSSHVAAGASMSHMMELAGKIVSIGNQAGEGWMLAGEMAAMAEEGVTNFICVQPFGCLPNHIIGKGIMKKFRTIYPETNIVKIDYDPGASEVNQLNRIRLMLDSAR